MVDGIYLFKHSYYPIIRVMVKFEKDYPFWTAWQCAMNIATIAEEMSGQFSTESPMQEYDFNKIMFGVRFPDKRTAQNFCDRIAEG